MTGRRILIAEYIHEICSFNPVPTRYHDFFVNTGSAMFDYHRQSGTEVCGALRVFSQRPELEVVPTFSARGITSGGTIPAADFDRICSEFVESIRSAGPVDAAYFALHGATAADGEVDPEGRLLELARGVLGESIPIVASFDLHGVITDRMLQHCNAISIYHTYPHVDFLDTGARAANLLLKLLDGEIHPVIAKVEIPALVRGDQLITETGLFGQLLAQARQKQVDIGGLGTGYFIGNPFTDVPDLRSYAIMITENDADAAAQAACEMARDFWQHREQMQAKLHSLTDAVRLALASSRPVALVDAADATSSGASGDSVEILRELRRQSASKRTLAPVVDSAAVDTAFAAGPGATVTVSVGGSLDRQRFHPMEITGKVRLLSDGRFRSESFGWTWNSGRTAVVESDPFTLVITSRPVHLFDRSLFLAHGQNPQQFDITIVKSPHCERHMYADWCEMIHADAPGSTSANLRSLGHQQSRRPVFPLDDVVNWSPTAKLFSRPQ